MDILFEWARALLHMIRSHDYLAMYLILTVEEAGLPLPLPGDTIVAFAGHLATQGILVWWGILVAAVGASVSGSLPLYWLARAKGRPALLRYGKFIHLNPKRTNRIEGWLQKHGGVAVFVGRLVPGMRVGTTALAGVFEIPFHVFLAYLLLSALVWWGFWLWLGSAVITHLKPLLELSPFEFGVTAVVIGIIVGAILYIRRKGRASRQPAALTVDVQSSNEEMVGNENG